MYDGECTKTISQMFIVQAGAAKRTEAWTAGNWSGAAAQQKQPGEEIFPHVGT